MAATQRPIYFNMNVYSRPNGRGIVQHIGHTITNDDPSSCFNLQSRHIGSVDTSDPYTKLIFYRSKDCLGAPIHSINSACTHSTTTKLMIKAKSVAIKRMKLVSVE